MKLNEMRAQIKNGALERYSNIYSDLERERERFVSALDAFAKKYGEDRDVAIFSVPGRSEISGNHTDHNKGKVMAGAINRDIIAVASKNSDGFIRIYSEGYPEDSVKISETSDPKAFKKFTSHALVGGLVSGFLKDGYEVGGFDAYTTTDVLKGSGLSSSAAFEVMIGNILNHLYNDGRVDNKEIAKLSQYSENVFFGKPSGLMDQMACAVGGFVYIDFETDGAPIVSPIEFSLKKNGYALCIVNTGGSHANLNADYAAVPAEMRAVAAFFGREVLRGLCEADIINNAPALRQKVGDRAILRALHFLRENDRVEAARAALVAGDISAFLGKIAESGRSSFEYLQNVYTNSSPEEQGLSLALAVSSGFLSQCAGAWRVHGGGFAGTIQAFVPIDKVEEYSSLMESVFGAGAVMKLDIRPLGAVRLF